MVNGCIFAAKNALKDIKQKKIEANIYKEMLPLKCKSSIIFVGLFFLLLYPYISLADIYSFTDEEGVIHFTNVPTDPKFKLIAKERYIDYESVDYMSLISKMSKKYMVDDALIRAIIKVESDFDPRAVSKAGAKGLMQLMPETAKDLGVENVFNPEENVEGGVKYLKSLISRFEDNLPLAIAAYHAGGGAVKKYNDIPPFDSTQKFVKRVLNYFEKYKNSSSAGKD